ncbi:ribonuclease H-like domain-containing protein, partial [Tanacetum coccineum]
KSNAEVLGYEEEISRGIFAFRETNAGYNDIPLYSRFKQVEYKGVPHPLSGDYTPREQEDIDDSLYEYGKYGPQPQTPSPTVSNASSIVFSICPSNDSDGELGAVSNNSSTHYSTCQSNDSDGEQGTVSENSANNDSIPIPSSEQVSISTQKTQSQVPTPPQTVDPSCAQHVKTPRQPIRTPVTPSPIPSYKRQNWNQRMERELGAGYSFERKPCFVCGSLSHLIKNCDYYEKKMAREAALKSKRVIHVDARQARPAWTNTNRVNKANQFTPRPVQLSNIRPNFSTASRTIKTGRVNVNTGKQNVSSGSKHVNAGSVHFNSGTQFKSGASRFNTGKQHVNSGRMYVNSGTQNKSGGSRVNTGKQNVNTARVNRPVLSNQTSQVNLKSPKKCFSKQSSPVNRPFSRNTAYKSNIYAVKGKMGTAVKTSAGCVWRKTTPLSNTNSGPTPDSYVHDHPLKHMEHRGIFDSGCSGHMTGNRAHLEDYQELSKVGSVTFGGSKGSISGKGTIRLGNLVFDDVAFVKELGHFNLFSISQICDKKLNVLFTEKECFVVSSDFKMPDENQVLLKVPRQHNMYTFDMKNVDSSKGYTCLLAKASSNEAKLWHRRLGHLNFKNLNKLVKDNLVRGLPSKSFKNDHTCVACQKGKQHKASWKIRDRWMFDLDYLSDSMNYIPVSMHNQANPAGSKELFLKRLLNKKTHSPKHPSSTPISKSVDDIMTFRKELDALALKHLGPVPATAPTNQVLVDFRNGFYDDDGIFMTSKLPDEFEPRKVSEALEDGSWVEAMQEELLQFKLQQVWVLVDLPNGVFCGAKALLMKRFMSHKPPGCVDPDSSFKEMPWLQVGHIDKTFYSLEETKGYHGGSMLLMISFLGLPTSSWCDEFEAFDAKRFHNEKSTTGGCQFLVQRSYLLWAMQETDFVATSTTEAVYVAVQIALWTSGCGF